MKNRFFFHFCIFYCSCCVGYSSKDFPTFQSSAEQVFWLYLFQTVAAVTPLPHLPRATFPDSRCKATPPSCPPHLPKEERSLSKNLATSKLSQFTHIPGGCSKSAINYIWKYMGYSANRGISVGTLSVPSEAVVFLTWAVPELAAFTFSICTASWLCTVPWTCGQCSVPRRWGGGDLAWETF